MSDRWEEDKGEPTKGPIPVFLSVDLGGGSIWVPLKDPVFDVEGKNICWNRLNSSCVRRGDVGDGESRYGFLFQIVEQEKGAKVTAAMITAPGSLSISPSLSKETAEVRGDLCLCRACREAAAANKKK